MAESVDFKALFDRTPAATLVIESAFSESTVVPEAELRVVYGNQAARALFGALDLKSLGLVIGPAFLADDDLLSEIQSLDPTSPYTHAQVEKQVATDPETRLDVLFHVALLHEDSNRRRFVVYAKDITPGRELQRRLEWLSVLPEANPNIVVIVSYPKTVEYLNPAGTQWLRERGLESPEGIRALLPEDFDRASSDKWVRELDGRTYDIRRRPLGDGERCMLTVADVTDLRRLSREHELFYSAFHAVRTAIVVTDGDGRIEFVNPHFERVYGYSKEEAIGAPASMVNPGRAVYRELGYSDQDYDRIFAGLWSAIRDPEIGYWEGELPNRAADGRIVWVHMLIQAVPLQQGEGTCYIGFPIDITDNRLQERQVRLETYEAIAGLGELRDNETGNHMRRVGRYARCLAEERGFSRRFQEDILAFAPFHDIGKVGIPDEILLAPRKLTAEEFRRMQSHTVLGAQLFRDKPSLEMAADIALSHHERWDGSGYPNAIAGEEIPACARLVSVCDVYDALTSDRPYKRSWDHQSTVATIAAGRGTQFEPGAVDAFMARHEQFAEIRRALPDR